MPTFLPTLPILPTFPTLPTYCQHIANILPTYCQHFQHCQHIANILPTYCQQFGKFTEGSFDRHYWDIVTRTGGTVLNNVSFLFHRAKVHVRHGDKKSSILYSSSSILSLSSLLPFQNCILRRSRTRYDYIVHYHLPRTKDNHDYGLPRFDRSRVLDQWFETLPPWACLDVYNENPCHAVVVQTRGLSDLSLRCGPSVIRPPIWITQGPQRSQLFFFPFCTALVQHFL
jgi:hypothetical protein